MQKGKEIGDRNHSGPHSYVLRRMQRKDMYSKCAILYKIPIFRSLQYPCLLEFSRSIWAWPDSGNVESTLTFTNSSPTFPILEVGTAAMHSCRLAVNDVDESRLQASATDQETIDIRLLRQLATVFLRNASTVEDSGVLGGRGGNVLLEPLADGGVDFLCLLGGRDLASANSPNTPLDLDNNWCGSPTRWAHRQ